MASLPPIPPNISQLTAPLLIGALVNYALYGVLAIQVCVYHVAFPEDAKRFKALVYTILIIETVQVCLSAADIHYWFAEGYGNLIHLGNVHFSSFDDPFLGSISSLIAQQFFCYRIWSLERRALPLSIFISCISIVQLGGGVSATVYGYIGRTFAKGTEDKRDALIWLVGNAVADILIAVSLTFLLLRQRRKDQPWTNNILMRIVRLVVETNCLTSAVAIISLALFLALPKVPYFVCPTAFLGKLYTNSLLVSLNNRLFFQRRTSHGEVLSTFDACTTPTMVRLRSTKNQSSSEGTSSGTFKPADMYGSA